VLLAQLSDPHVAEAGRLIEDRIDTAAHLAAAVEHVNRLAPAAVLVTGDLVDSGAPTQYAELRRLLDRLTVPRYLLPGNHDDRETLRAAFPDHLELHGRPWCDYVVDVGPMRLVCLDTTRPGEAGGRLEAEQLAWLEATLAGEADLPTLVALHHPPFATGIDHMDAMALDVHDAAGLEAVVGRHRHVERVLCGHLHRLITRRWAGTVAMSVPGTAHAVALDLDGGQAAWTFEPPMVTLHAWRPGEGVVTHLQTIGDHPPTPYA
jgi:Icc protein